MLLKCIKTVHTVDQFVNFNKTNVAARRSREIGNRRSFYSNGEPRDFYPPMKKHFCQFIECCKYEFAAALSPIQRKSSRFGRPLRIDLH